MKLAPGFRIELTAGFRARCPRSACLPSALVGDFGCRRVGFLCGRGAAFAAVVYVCVFVGWVTGDGVHEVSVGLMAQWE